MIAICDAPVVLLPGGLSQPLEAVPVAGARSTRVRWASPEAVFVVVLVAVVGVEGGVEVVIRPPGPRPPQLRQQPAL